MRAVLLARHRLAAGTMADALAAAGTMARPAAVAAGTAALAAGVQLAWLAALCWPQQPHLTGL